MFRFVLVIITVVLPVIIAHVDIVSFFIGTWLLPTLLTSCGCGYLVRMLMFDECLCFYPFGQKVGFPTREQNFANWNKVVQALNQTVHPDIDSDDVHAWVVLD